MTTVEGLHFFLDRLKNFHAAILVQEMNIQKIQRRSGPDLVVNVILAALMEKGDKPMAEKYGAQAKILSWKDQLKNPEAAKDGL